MNAKPSQRFQNPSCILVTGCAGFIATNFIRYFKEEFPSTTVAGVDDFSGTNHPHVDKGTVFCKGSITNPELLDKIFKKHRPEYVFHFAALPRVSYTVEHPLRSSEVNVLGTIALLTKAKDYGVKRFIFSSSSAIYGLVDRLPTREDWPPNPQSPYAVQKYSCELFCKLFSDLFGLETVCLRYFNVFGPEDYGDSPYSTVVGAWLESLYFPKNKKGFIEGDGKQSRDFCYVDNVVLANILAMRSEKSFMGEVFNIAEGKRTTLNQVRQLIEQFTQKTLLLEKRPAREGDVRHTHADVSRAKQILGYSPSINFEEGLRRTIAWFESRLNHLAPTHQSLSTS